MKTHRWILSPIFLSLLVLAWSGTSASAQTFTPSMTVDSSVTIPVSGTVTEPDGTVLTISGSVLVSSNKVTDADGTSPRVVLGFDFSKVTASDGITGTGVLKTGGFQDFKIRPLQESDELPITCPYFLNKNGVSTAETWLVTTTLKFDVLAGTVVGGSTTVGNNPYLLLLTSPPIF